MVTIPAYHTSLTPNDREICELLRREIDRGLPEAESKIWHAHPVWFIRGNPIVGYSRQRAGIRLMFWSGRSFDEPDLIPGSGRFQDASVFYTSASQIDTAELTRWLEKSRTIQWDYKNIVKRKGELVRIV